MSSNSQPPIKFLAAVALVAAAVLGFEIALTRVFGTVLRYHFAFLVISMALCGLGLGGYAAHLAKRQGILSRPNSLSTLAVAFALSIDGALLILMRGVFAYFPELYWLAALIVLIPFGIAGAFLAEAFARYPQHSGRLYAWDLAGAALAAVGIVGVLQVVSAYDACLLMALLAIAAAWFCGLSSALPVWTGIVVVVAVLNIPFRLIDVPPLPPKIEIIEGQPMSLADKGMTQPLFTELGTPGHTSRIIDTRWNAFARTDVVSEGPTPKPGQTELDASDMLLVYTNGNVPTNMMKWNGNVGSIPRIARDFPLSDWAFAVAPLGGRHAGATAGQRAGQVLAIGPGGGLDALLAIRHGAEDFYGAEINPSIVGLMSEPKYRQFNGNIYGRRDVHVQTAEGRAFVRDQVQQGKKFSLVYSALTKTATAAQGMALLESFIYTSDAFEDYWRALENDGQIAIVLDSPILVARFFTTALTVMQKHGIDAQTACRHVAIVNDPRPGPYQFAIVIQKTPLTKEQTAQMYLAARIERSLSPLWIPEQAAEDGLGPYQDLASGKIKLAEFEQFFSKNVPPLDVTPRPDDRPFVLDMSTVTPPIMVNLGYGLGALLLLALLFLGWGLTQDRQSGAALRVGDAGFVLYFLCLGVGFMLVEIPLISKLVLPLGYPTLSLTVILFSLLLGGGAGAALSQSFDGARLRAHGFRCAMGVAVATLIFAMLLPRLDGSLLSLPLTSRCLIVALLLLPLGVLLGTPFPTGMRLFASERAASVPLIWGLNGVASVCGSYLAALGARTYGFHAMLLAGAALYAIAALLLLISSPQTTAATPRDDAQDVAAESPQTATVP